MLKSKIVLQKGNKFKIFATNGYVESVYAHAPNRFKYVGRDAEDVISKHLANGWIQAN